MESGPPLQAESAVVSPAVEVVGVGGEEVALREEKGGLSMKESPG